MTTKLTARQADKLIEAAQNAIEYTVEGTSSFPVDMLRYDRCWPAHGTDASYIATHPSTTLIRIHLQGLKLPTVTRWESFGWRVVES